MKPWRKRTRAERTIKNPRWWVILPISVPFLILVLIGHLITTCMIEVGYWLGRLGDRLHYRKLNKPMERLFDWMKNDPNTVE